MPTPREQIERFNELQDFVTNQLPKFAEQVLAADLVALVTNRVVQKGENFKGASFSPYSIKQIGAFRFVAKSRNNSADRKIRALAKAQTPLKNTLSYEEFRELNNLRTNKKNFEFTGEMWRKFGVIQVNINGDDFLISIGGQSTTAQKKIDENSAREGISIIEANQAEIALAQKAAQDWLVEQADRILNGN